MVRTLDEVGLRAAADVLVTLDLVASVGAAGAVVFDRVLLLEARVSGCAPPSTTQAAHRSAFTRSRAPTASKRMQAEQAARLWKQDRLRNQDEACKPDHAHCARTRWDEQQQHAEQEQRQLHERGGRRHQELHVLRCRWWPLAAPHGARVDGGTNPH
eukprot:COSAG02_NODE_13672_length_1364_cov_2.948617_2_plen_157_part_00